MWVFGYGSLIWDGWEAPLSCSRRAIAVLVGYTRTFNKASVVRWGTKKSPCPTLNLAPEAAGSCTGMAFEFFDDREQQVLDYLRGREGKDFELERHTIRFGDDTEVQAYVPIYQGKNLIPAAAQKAAMVKQASGTAGTGVTYVKGIVDKLSELGIADPAVSQLWQEIQKE